MPYCPKCDMEFVDGINICSDCKEPLVESREVADAIKQKEMQEASARQRAEYESMQGNLRLAHELDNDDDNQAPPLTEKDAKAIHPHTVYVKKSQQYEDLKSSASAFMIVGSAILIFAALCWINIIKLPMTGIARLISQGVITIMAIIALFIAFTSTKSANAVSRQIADEESTTKQLLHWFLDRYNSGELDAQILKEYGELGAEEQSLRRFDLIQDIFATYGIEDQGYIDLIAEEVYGEMFRD